MKLEMVTGLLFALTIFGCTSNVGPITINNPNNNNSVKTNQPANILNKEDIAQFDKEYLPFTTKALTISYIKRKLIAFLEAVPVKGNALVKEIAYAIFKFPDTFCDAVEDVPGLLGELTAVNAVSDRMAIDQQFSDFLNNSFPPTNVIFVKWNATGNNNGTSWTNAYTSLQTALTNASPGKEIWVAQGTYIPGTSDRHSTFQLKDGVAVYGGFSGNRTEIKLSQRDISTNAVILSGDLNGDDVDDDFNNFRNDDAYNVVTGATGATIDGVTIKYGNASGDGVNYHTAEGGGMSNYYASPTLNNINFSNNSSQDAGGGISNDNSSPTINNINLSNNRSQYGGGMYNHNNSVPTVTNATFFNNTAYYGGGNYNNNSSPVLNNVTFHANLGEIRGGGIYNEDNSFPTVNNSYFIGNQAQYGAGIYNYNSSPVINNITFLLNEAHFSGGGIFNSNSSPSITNVTFYSNFAYHGGGGGIFNSSSTPAITNVTFNLNYAPSGGGGISNFSSSPEITNATFTNNFSDFGKGIANNNNSSPTIKNSIIWEGTNNNVYNAGGSSPIITYSDIQEGYTGTGNINEDPKFKQVESPDGPDGKWRTADDGLSLTADSPALVKIGGTPTGAPLTDIIGAFRLGSGVPGGVVSMGAYEYVELSGSF